MKQLGNLALVCAKRKSTRLEVENGTGRVTVCDRPGTPPLCFRWDDDEKIMEVIHELNFGKYKES